jgi:hypothetical protein
MKKEIVLYTQRQTFLLRLKSTSYQLPVTSPVSRILNLYFIFRYQIFIFRYQGLPVFG